MRMKWWTRDPGTLHGQPRFVGTRVPLDVAEAYRREGASMRQFLDNYPGVRPEFAGQAWDIPLQELYDIICGGPSDPYGVTESQLEAARTSHGNIPFARMGMYVPTRAEVRTLPPDDLEFILDCWVWESPSELIPTHTQIAAVRYDLRSRPDAQTNDVEALIEICNDFLEEAG
jgi:uncharacterized protein (DUF433 family)